MKKLATYLLFISLLLVVGVNETWSAEALESWIPSSTSYQGSVFIGTNITITAEGSWTYAGQYGTIGGSSTKSDGATYPDAVASVSKDNVSSFLTEKTYFKIHANSVGTIKVNGLYGGNASKIVVGITEWNGNVTFKEDPTNDTSWGSPCSIEFQTLNGRDYYIFVPNGGNVLFQGFEFYESTGINIALSKQHMDDDESTYGAKQGSATMNVDYPFFATSTLYPGATAYGVDGYSVTLNATPSNGYLFWRWKLGSGENYVYSNNTTITNYAQYATDGTLTITPEFVNGIHVYTKVEGCGIATFSHWGEQRENGYWTTPWTDFTFTATPDENYTFEGWYNGDTQVSTANPYTAQGVYTDLTLTAKFTRSDSKSENETKTFDLSTITSKDRWMGNVTSVTYGNGEASITTKGSNTNLVTLYSGLSGVTGTGIRVSSMGVQYRIVLKTSDSKTFVYHVPATSAYTTNHYTWKDFIQQWTTSNTMTSEDVAKVTDILIGGDDTNANATDQTFYVNGFWIDNIADYAHTFPGYGEEGGSWNGTTNTYTFTLDNNGKSTTNGTSAAFNPIYTGGDRDSNGNIKLYNGGSITLTKSNYNFTSVKIVFASSCTYNLSIGGITYQGTGEAAIFNIQGKNATITNNSGVELFINKIIYTAEGAGINESRSVTTNGVSRPYWLYVPANVRGTSTAVPVVFSLHGAGGSYDPTSSSFSAQNFNELADQNNFIVVYPNGTSQYFPGWGGTANGWAATGADNADIQYFRDILSAIESDSEFKVDASKIYMTGFSNGGMMTYAVANVMPNVFAAFASISGFPMNEMHLRHCGDRPVPFLHIHGKADDFVKYSLSPIIIDNMVARNGLPYTPTTTVNGSGYDYYAYEATGKQPYYFYAVDGMGHSNTATINSQSNQQIIWDFFKERTLSTEASTIEFAPDLNTETTTASSHGWGINSGNIIAEYGESGGYTTDTYNVYHSLQLKKGTHHLNFTAINADETKYVVVKLIKLGALSQFDAVSTTTFSIGADDILMSGGKEKMYKVGETSFTFTTDEDAEYQLIFEKGAESDATTISNVSITTTGTDKGTVKEAKATTDHTSYVNYHNRLSSQWNFDSCDGYRFNETTAKSNTAYWTVYTDNYNNGNGTKTYTYNQAIGGTTTDPTLATSYGELTYDGSSVVPVTAGLKFLAPAGNITIKVNYTNGSATGVNLIVNDNVKMLIPNVENTYRNDNGTEGQPPYNLDTEENQNSYNEYKNCVHHWKRDIIYVSLEEGTTWGATHFVNKCIDNSNKTLFNNGGSENIDDHYFDKLNYTGNAGTPCVLQFNGTTSFSRLGINRNLTYSFYPEYISDLGSSYTKPEPRMRIIGSPQGQKVANIGSTYTVYSNAIAMTFGGWKNTADSYSYSYKGYNGSDVTDKWGELDESASANSIAVDGFSVLSHNNILPTSESLMPSETTGNKYHEACNGIVNTINDGEKNNVVQTYYIENFTPWTIPCRGAYIKFEPTIPGVLNVNVFQTGYDYSKVDITDKNYFIKKYYILDEFGKPVSDGVYCKTESGVSIDKSYAGFRVQYDSYVKYSFNVYPGKTYYMLSPTAGIGFAGFYFEPYVYRTSTTDELARQDIEMKSLTLEDGVDYKYESDLNESVSKITSPGTSGDVTYDIYSSNKAVSVELNRSFKANIWNSICLPFSMNNLSMETVFGKGTKVVLLRDIQDAEKTTSGLTTANFIMHENQDIVAGYPYLIYPTQDVTSIKTNAYIATTSPSIPTINSVGFNTALGTGDYGGITDFDFTGTFSSETEIPAGSYYMNTKGNLTRASKKVTMKPYRAYLAAKTINTAKTIGAIFLGNMIDEDEDTATGINNIGIEDVVTESVNIKADANIYNMQGQKIGDSTSDLNSLPKGVYIINGKKYIVK